MTGMANTPLRSKAPARQRFVLASASPRRLQLLQQIGLEPDEICQPHVDETPEPVELPRALCLRLAEAKARTVAKAPDSFVLAADTVVACGRRILPKPEAEGAARACLQLLSGRAHRVYTGLCLQTPDGHLHTREVQTRVSFMRLSDEDIAAYLASGEWRGKAGGYAIQGLAARFIRNLNGSYSNVVGLPLYETANLLRGNGFTL